jgi:hypothetical protein
MINPMRGEAVLTVPAMDDMAADDYRLVLDAAALIAIEEEIDESWLALADRVFGFDGTAPKVSELAIMLQAMMARHNPIDRDQAITLCNLLPGEVGAALGTAVRTAMPAAEGELFESGEVAEKSDGPLSVIVGIGMRFWARGLRLVNRLPIFGNRRRVNGL